MGWCETCHRHSFMCECELEQHIFVVEYVLVISAGETRFWCQERVRAIANNPIYAREAVENWAATTPTIWWTENLEIVENPVPAGDRQVQVGVITRYAENVGPMLKQCPLPAIFPHEE